MCNVSNFIRYRHKFRHVERPPYPEACLQIAGKYYFLSLPILRASTHRGDDGYHAQSMRRLPEVAPPDIVPWK
jgi:hypothetical protein